MFIRSERLFLRPAWPEDSEELLARIGNEAIVRNLARVPWPYTPQDAQAFVRKPQDHRLPSFLITVPGADGSRIVGGCGLSLLDDEVNLGYWVAANEQRQGYATEAARAVLSLARSLGHQRIVAHHFVDNAASGRVLEKVGFRRTGRVTERFSLSRGYASPSREYEVVFETPADCGGDGEGALNRRRAA